MYLFVSIVMLFASVASVPLPAPVAQVGGPVGAGGSLPSPQDQALIQTAVTAFVTGRPNAPGNPVQIVSSEFVNWPDSCLGVSSAGVDCLMVVTPGYLLEAGLNGKTYQVHTNLNATSIRIVPVSVGSLPGIGTPIPGPIGRPQVVPIEGPSLQIFLPLIGR